MLRLSRSLAICAILLYSITGCEFQLRMRNDRTPASAPSPTPAPFSQLIGRSLWQTTATAQPGCVAVDPADGSRYIATMFNNTLTVGSTTYSVPTYNGQLDLVVQKQNRSGTVLWSKQISGDYTEQTFIGVGKCMTITAGKVFLAFLSNSPSVSIDGNAYAQIGSMDGFIAGFNTTDGTPSLVRQFASSSKNYGVYGITSRGNTIYFSGFTTDTSVPGPVTPCTSGCAYYGSMNATTGAINWVKRWGGNNTSVGYAIEIDSAQRLFVSGTYSFTGNDPDIGGATLDAIGQTAGFIMRVSESNGSVSWIRSVDSTPIDTGNIQVVSLASDLSGNIYASLYNGVSSITIQGQAPLAMTAGSTPIASFDSNGNFRWVKVIGTVLAVQIVFDPITSTIWTGGLSVVPPINYLFQMDLNGNVLKSLGATVSGAWYILSIGLDPGISSVVMATLVNGSATLDDGQTFTSSGNPQGYLLELK